MTMSSWRWWFAVLLAAFIALAPALAEARAGGGSSQGSRGSRTYQSNQAQPTQRSTAPQTSPSQTVTRPGPMGQTPGGFAQPSFAQRHPFLTGIMGGFIGAGIAGMLFGNHAWAADGSGAGSMLGMLLQLALIGGLIYLVVQFFRRRSALATAGGPAQGYGRAADAMPARAADPVEIRVTENDYNEWSRLLVGIQDAWSRSDLGRMRQFVTPEMVGYFSEQLSTLASRGVENRVEQVELLKGDVEEAWAEGDLEYVTARLRWRATDYTVRIGTNEVVEGNPQRPEDATEVWTFVRNRGGNWLLSAIQQA
jgi:predicted lipid-binding transport protein (Tim44 family)